MRKKFLLMLTLLILALGGGGNLFAQNVAKVGNIEYATIDEAIANWTNGTTLTLLNNVNLTNVITLSSQEHHYLALGTCTMTAASGMNAIEVKSYGRGDRNETGALTITADATNPGSIKAGSKACIYYKYDATLANNQYDRPIIYIKGGVFVSSSYSGISCNGHNSAQDKCATFNISGGTFNCGLNLTKAKLIVSGGTFNNSVNCTGGTTSHRLISGGTFKSFGFMTADAVGKFTIGTTQNSYNVGVHVDDNGYLVVGGAIVTEPNTGSQSGVVHEASTANYGGWSSYLEYSSAKDNGLYYTSVEEALADNNKTTGSVTVYVDELDMNGISYKGTIVVPEGNTLTITNAPQGLKVKDEDGNDIDPNANGTYSTIPPVAQIGEVPYYTLADAINYATNGQTITLIDNVVLAERVTIPADKTLTIDLNGKSISMEESIIATAYAINNLGNLTITDSGDGGSINARGIYNGYGDGGANVATANITVVKGTINAKGTNGGGAAIFNYGVADIQGGTFTSVASYAIALQTGSTMTIGENAIITGGINSWQSTLTITGGTISNDKSGKHVVYAGESAVTINGGTFHNNNSGNATIMASGSTAAVEITGGTFTLNIVDASSSYLIDATSSATYTISGGSFTGGIRAQGGTKYEITGGTFTNEYGNYNVYEGGDIDISGGTFTGYYAQKFATDNLAAGYELGENGTVVAKPVAEVNGTKYTSIEAALAAATAGSEIKLLADVEAGFIVPDGVTFNGNGFAVGGIIVAAGDITFAGVTKAADLDFNAYNTIVNIPTGASLQLDGTNRMSIGFGTTFNIIGTITDAKTADKATLTPSLVIPGASFSGSDGVKFNVTNAYISVPSSYCSTSKTASGTFDFNITNSIWESAGKLAFEEQSTSAKVDFALVNSVLTTGSHLVFGATSGEEGVVIDNSNVNVGTSRQLENCGNMIVKNGSVVNGAVATSSNAKNPGTIIVENATYAVTGEFSGSDLGIGTLIIKKGANVSVGSIKAGANVTVDATDMVAGDEINFTANLSQFTGTLSVINNDKLEAQIVNGKIVLVAKPVAKIGETPYATLEDAFKAATSGCTIDILLDVTVDTKWDCRYTGAKFTVPVTINGNGKTIKFTGEVSDMNWYTIFRFEGNATVNNLTVDIENASSAQRVISAKKSLNVDGLNIVGSARYGIIFGEGASATDLAATEIVVKNSTLNGTRRAISDNEGGKDVKSVVIDNNTLNANAYISASESITFNNNIANGEVDLRSYTAENVLSVVAKENTLKEGVKNYIYAKTIDAQEEFTTENPPLKVSTKAELDAALAAAQDGDIIVMTADIDYGTSYTTINKAITLDLGGKILTTSMSHGSIRLNGGCTLKNGTLNHNGGVAALKVWDAAAIENLVINVAYRQGSTIGGIVIQENAKGVASIKNVTIQGEGLTNGIETYNCGNTTENVIGSMENVTIDAVGTGMLISAPCGTATNCNIKGGVNGIEIWIKGNYSASLDLVKSNVEGGVYAHDEINSTPGVVNNGTLSLTADYETTGAGVEDVTLTIARAENLDGVIEEVMEAAQAKIGNTYYTTLAKAVNAVQNGETITLIADITENVTLTEKTGLYYTIDGDGKTMTGTITVSSLSDTNDNRRITIKNINFVDTVNGRDFITSTATNHYPRLTVESCSFTGTGKEAANSVAVRLKSSHSVVIKDCTGTGLHSFLQNTSGWNLTIENVKVENSKSGLALGTVQGVTVKGCNITADGYGIRMDAQYNNNAVIESNTVKAFIPVVVRKAEVNSNMTFEGENEFEATNEDDIWCAIGTSEYDTNGTMPTAATGRVKVALNDTGLDAAGIYGNFVPVAKIGEVEYASLQEAIIAAAPAGTVDIIADITVDEWIMIATNLTMGDGTIITLDINGMTINGNNHNITIKDIESAGNGGYLFYDAAELNIKDLTISYAAGLTGGICLKKGTIEKVTFTGGKYGVLPGANGVTIKECTFNGTTSYAVYYEDAREGIVVTGNKFNTAEGAYAIIMRSNEEFTNNTIEKGKVNIANSSKATVTGNNFGTERFKVYNGATATIKENTINVLAFNDNSVVKSTFSENTLSDAAQAVFDAMLVAKIGEVGYLSLQNAVNAVQNGQTITLVSDVTEDVTLTEKVGLYYTIDGAINRANNTMNGKIVITPLSDENDNRRITIKNINFVNTADAAVDFISCVVTNHYPRLTVEGCTFTGNGKDTDVALRLKTAYGAVIKNCTGTGLHSFLQNTAGKNLIIENVKVTDSKSGLALGTVQGVTVKGSNIDVAGYGIRMDANTYNNNAVIESNTVEAFIPVVVRKVNTESNITFNGENTFTATNTDGLWCAIGATEYETNGEMPTAPATGNVSVTLNDAGLDVEGIYGYTISGEGTAEKPYLINNINDLIVFRNNVNAGNNYSGKYVKLNADIDLINEAWEPIGYKGKNFIGNFDGGNHTISNLKVVKELDNASANNSVGLFGRVDSPATIKNLTINNATVKGSLYVGAVVGYAYTGNSIENVTVKGNIAIDAWWYAGVIGGNGYMSLVNNCHVIGNDGSYIKGNNGSYIGGIWGFRGEGANNITNCTVTNLAVEGVDRVGGISGMAHYGNTISGCSVDDVTIAATDEEATTVGIIAGACQGTVSEPSTITYSEVVDVTVTIGGNNVDASIYGTNIDGTTPYTNYVARIGGMQYITLADAVAAAKDGETIEFLPLATNKVVAMNASLYGKSVTITGTAKVDWSKGWLFVGRGGEGNATLTFDGANLTSASNNTSTGIHVSGREKNTTNKYDGTVVIKNSTIELDYLINRGTMTLDNNATLTVKNGFGIAGRPASETESGEDATATIALNNGSKVVVNNHNGMGLGYEAIGVMNINDGSTFECTQDFLVTAKGTMNVDGGIVTTKVKITNNGVINVSGESTLNIASLEGEEINFLDGATIKDSNIGGVVFVAGNVTFDGDNTFNMIYDYGTLTDYYGTTAPMKWNVKEGASLTLTEKARYGLGYGDKVTIIGSIDNALTARENLTENERSLFMHGLVAQESKGWNCSSTLNIENAYVVIGNNNSFGNKPGNYGGTYTFNIKNSVVDASRITFYEALSTSTFTFDGSDVKMGTFMTNDEDSKFTLKDSKVLSTTTTNGTDEGNYNAGQLILENSSLTYSATLTNKGTIELDTRSTLTAPAISGAGTITIDAADFVIGKGDKHVVTANMNGFTGTINVDNNNYVTAERTETGIVIKENELEGEGSEAEPYIVSSLTELELFRNKVNAGDNYAGEYVKLTANVDLSATRSANNWEPIGTTACPFMGTFDGADDTISNLVVEGENYVGLFGKTVDATINNVTINNANVRGTSYVGAIVGMGHTGTINNCHVTGTIQIEGNYMVGGISGQGYAIIYNSSVIATANSGSYVKGVYSAANLEGDNVGGIVGHCGENNTLTANTVKNITVSGTRKVGGIVGIADMSTDIDACVVENVTIETSASQDYADDNINTMSIGALIGQYQNRGSNGTVTNSTVKNVTFNNVYGVTVNGRPISAGPITGGTRGGSESMLAPEGVTSSNNDIYMSTITGSSNLYLMNPVAEIDGEYYYTLQEAFNAGGEVVVLKDITLEETATIAAGKTVVLDLNGWTISQEKACTGNYNMILNKGNLKIEGNGRISFNDTGAGDPNFGWGSYTLRNEGTLVVENGTIEHLGEQNPGNGQPNVHMYCAIFQYSGSTTINGGTISTPTYRSARLWKGNMTINGGSFEGQLWVQAADNSAELTINGGTFAPRGNDGSSVFVSNSTYYVAFAVTGGTFDAKIGASDVEKAGVKGAITGGLFTEAAKNGTDAKLIDARFKFENMPNAGGYYTVIQFAGTQTREFASAGWYWFSTYIDLEGTDGLDTLQEALGENAKQIKGQDGFTQYYKAYQAWSPGGLTAISTAKMYMINTTDPVTVELTGDFVDYEERDITLNPGWNWIGYPVRDTVNVKDALAKLTPSNGDAIKSKDWTMTYIMGQWLGSREMTPGMGYMYKSNAGSVKTFRYSTNVTNNSRSENTVEEYHWIADATKYPSNMTVIAMLNIDGEVASDNYEVAAFANGECRGSARPFYVEAIDSYILIMTIQGEEVEELTFKCYDVNYDTEYELSNRFNYSSDAILGSIEEPYMFNMNFLNIEESSLDMINIYPNPTTRDRAISLQATCDNVEVFNALGVKIAEYQNVDTIDALETAGVYVIRVTINGEVKNCRLVVE